MKMAGLSLDTEVVGKKKEGVCSQGIWSVPTQTPLLFHIKFEVYY